MPDQGGEKTEKATAKKREDERKKGNVSQSKDLTTMVSLLVSFYSVGLFLNSFLTRIQENYVLQMERVLYLDTLLVEDIMEIAREFLMLFATTALPPMILVGFATAAIVMFQTRFLIAGESLKMKLERINPISGFKRMFSLRSLVELAKSIIKIVLLTAILYYNIRGFLGLLPGMMDWEISQAAAFTGSKILSLVLSVGISFGAVAAIDYLYQYWEYEKNIRMTKQEVKDEYKQMEGNPEIKSERRQRQREMAQQRMMQQVKDADVVVRNPTHFAVALRYKMGDDPAPVVVAKGMDHVALRIVEEAEKHAVATIENKPLARSLYELAEIDGFIPPELFQPVAEVLAWLYSTREKEKDSQ